MKGNHYQPKYRAKWETVDRWIYSNWESSLVEPSDRLPYPFLTIASDGRKLIFYWDVYFTNAGLFFHDHVKQYAKNNVNNLLYEVEQYGFVPNSSEPWGMNRSQPPFLSMMVREVYEHFEPKDKEWLKKAYYTLRKEYKFWTDDSKDAIEKHTTPIPFLLRYYHHANPDELLTLYIEELVPRLGLNMSIPDSEKIKIASRYAAEAESGLDFTPRFESRCPDFVAVDLNSNLYLYEKNFQWMVNELDLKNEPKWNELAERRKEMILKYLWNETRNLFMDYDYVNQRFNKVANLISFNPLFTGVATKEQANLTKENLKLFEYDWGVVACEKTEQKRLFQWDFPVAWPYTHYWVIKGLDNYGYVEDAKRIAAKYCDTVTKNFLSPVPIKFSDKGKIKTREPGRVYEKYNAVDGTICDREYPALPFMGWSTGVFVFAYNYYLSH